jgi:hypothetical protein
MTRTRMSRLLLVAAGTVALSAASVIPVLADGPAGDNHPDSNVAADLTAGERAALTAKHMLARSSARFAATGLWARVPSRLLKSLFVCETDCGGGGGGGAPPTAKTLDTRARIQSKDYYCGPASGQVVMNFTRGIFNNSLDGDSTSTNWKTQDQVAAMMGTTYSAGTPGPKIVLGLNKPDGVVRPEPDWTYAYEAAANGAEFHSWIVEDIGRWGMPVVPDVKPHQTGAEYFLPSWEEAYPGSKHWVVIRGYTSLWDGTDTPTVKYSDSAGWDGQHWQPGNYTTGALTMWKVTQALYGKAVW